MTTFSNKRITILGSTGSIGDNSLRVLAEFPQKFSVNYLTAHTNWEKLFHQAQRFQPLAVALTGIEPQKSIETQFKSIGIPLYWGLPGLYEIASRTNTDLVINALVGAVGLKPTLLALEAHKEIALSNKETLVIAGELVMQKAREQQITITPIDSEHSAIFQCLLGEPRESIRRLIITASGGPFLKRDVTSFPQITVAEALNHPNWSMGRKITIDSATLMNKGLEVIEAHWLFGLSPQKISVIIHPPSIIHSMVEFIDGSIKAQLGVPDMKIPIQYALSFPERWESPALPRLDLSQSMTMEFHPPDFNKFRTLKLAFSALEQGGTAPAVLNAANEIAVQFFLEEKIRFDQIFTILDAALEKYPPISNPTLDHYLEADRWGRCFATENYANQS